MYTPLDKMSKKEFLGVKLTKMVSQKQLQLVGKHTQQQLSNFIVHYPNTLIKVSSGEAIGHVSKCFSFIFQFSFIVLRAVGVLN